MSYAQTVVRAVSGRGAAALGLLVASATLLATREPVHNKSVRESVLAQPTLKANLHKPSADEAPNTIRRAAAEGDATARELSRGPCGDTFKAALACYKQSDAGPRGMDCIEHFKALQGCFRAHADTYRKEIDEDDKGQAVSPLPKDHPDAAKVPAKPTDTPPQNNAALHVDPSITPAKSPRRFA